jgi:antitoxin MazE
MVLYNVYTYRGSDKSSGGMQKKEGNMEIQLVKWGNGQGIRIPKLVLQELNIAVNDTLSMEVRGEQIIIEKVKFKHRSLEERARAYGGKLGPYTEYDWGEPKGREIW